MGLLLSMELKRPPPQRVINFVPDREVAPLTSLEELLEYKEQMLCPVEPLRDTIRRGRPEDPKTLFCHDMMGGYHEDRHVHGFEVSNPYRFHHWHVINTFVYYTHYLVTIPPPGWISAAHKHGVKVLGTFMLESYHGTECVKTIRDSGLVPKIASQLAVVASLGRFDGWLVSVGCSLDASCVAVLKDLVAAVTEQTHSAVPGSLVIWYDGVDTRGKWSPQNELNENNASFFELCDGIFLNFCWTEDKLQKSTLLAGDRKADVYVGIDVFARKTKYPGGYEMSKAVRTARAHGLSAAIFAAGWVYETQMKTEFAKNQYRLWGFPDDICPEWRLTAPPLSTTFCQGFGNARFSPGKVGCPLSVCIRCKTRPQRPVSKAWFNLFKQELRPRDQGNCLCSTCGSATVYLQDAYDGGGSLRLLFKANEAHPDAVPYFRLFACDFPLGSLTVSYTFKLANAGKLIGPDMALVLKAKTAAGETEELSLGTLATQPEGDNYVLRREVVQGSDAESGGTEATWMTRRYHVEDKRGADGAILDEIGACLSGVSSEAIHCLLGKLEVQRAGVSTSVLAPHDVEGTSNAGADEPAEKRPRIETPGKALATAQITD